MDQINWPRTRDILISVICIGIIFWASWTALGQFVDAIFILLISLAVAFLLTPLVNFQVKYGFPRIVATITTYIGVSALLIFLAYELIFSLFQQIVSFSSTIETFANTFATEAPKSYKSIIEALEKINFPVDESITQIKTTLIDFAKSLSGNVVLIITNAFDAFLKIFLITVMSFYLTLDGKRVRDSLVGVAPKRWLPNVLLFEDALNRVVGNYIRGQLSLATIVGIAVSIICLFTGLKDFALICGVLAFLFETIPMVGPGLASITPLLISLLLGGDDVWQRTLIIASCFIVLQIIESNILGPRIVGHAVGLHPVAAILSLLVFAKLFGVFGALIATPIVAAIWVVIASVYRSARGETADQMLARKRAPWTIRRPNARFPRTRSGDPKGEAVAVGHTTNGAEVMETDLIHTVEVKDTPSSSS